VCRAPGVICLVQAKLRQEQIRLLVEVPGDLPDVQANPQQMLQVALNLINNAAQALNDKYPDPHADKIIRLGGERVQMEGGKAQRIPPFPPLAFIPSPDCERYHLPPFKVINSACHVAVEAGIRPSRDPHLSGLICSGFDSVKIKFYSLPMPSRILVIEDDTHLRDTFRRFLDRDGYLGIPRATTRRLCGSWASTIFRRLCKSGKTQRGNYAEKMFGCSGNGWTYQ
jgi:hypothetical protein